MSTNTGTKRKMRSITAIAMVLAMVMSLFGGITFAPVTAYAAETSGKWSDGINYSYDTDTGVLTLTSNDSTTVGSSTVIMNNNSYPYVINEPFSEISKIVISEGITSIRDMAFADWKDANLRNNLTIVIPSTVTSIGKYAFSSITYGSVSVIMNADPDNITTFNTSAFCQARNGTFVSPYISKWIASDKSTYNSSANTITFDNTYKGIFSVGYIVSVNSTENGTVTADKASAAENDTVTLTVTPDENYEIDSVSYNDGSDHVITPVESVYSFSMPASNVTVSATFKAATPAAYTVTFDANGHGTAPSNQTITSSSKASTPTEPTDDGWTFGGWYKEADCTNAWDFDTDTVTADTTLYAKWTENANNTEELLTTITAVGESNVTPATSANVSYSTEGIATLSFTGSVSYQSSPSWGWWGYGWTATVTPADGYTITKCVFYDNTEATLTDSSTPFVVETTAEDKTPQVSGASFNSTTSKGIKKIDVYGYATTTATTTYTVTYDANGALEGSVPAELASYDANASVTVLGNTGDLEKDDYTFAGWNTKADGTGTDYAAGDTFTITADTTLYAKWTANTITVTFSTSTDGKTINKDGVTCNNSFDSYNNLFMGGTFSTTLGNFTRIVVTAQDTKRVGMDRDRNPIAGWSNNTWTGNASSVNFGAIMGNNNDVTIVFTITPVTNYTVTFNFKGGSDVTSASVAEGNKVSKPTNPTRDGYTFLGWSTEETSSTYYDFDTAVTSSFTLYAQWEKKVETGVSDTSDIAVAVEGLTDAIDTSDLNANQYVTSEIEVKNEAVTDVSNTVSNKVSEVKGTDSSITVNYLTIDISKIITTVNANGSTTDGTKTAVTELTKPIEVAIPNIDGDKVDIVREHVGTATQFTERNSRNTVPVSFVDGEYYYDKANKIVYIYSSKFSTYAILIKPANNTGGNPGGNTGGNTGGGTGGGGYSGPTYYTVTFNSNGGSTVTSQSVRSGNKVTKPADPTKEGYTFDGWYTTNSLTTEFDFNTAIYSSRTLYAKWTENTTPTPTVTTYQITYDLDGGTVAKANPTSYTKDTATFTLNNPTKSGYTFKGWIGSDLSKATVTVTVKKGSTGNRVYKATWEKNSDSSSEEDSSPVTPNGKTEEQNALTLNAGLKVSQTGKKITVKFGKVAGATSYEVYVAYCGQKFPTKATATTKKNSVSITKLNGKKLNLKKNFKIYVVAKKSKAKLGKTITAHVVGHKNVKYTNAKSIKITSKTTLTLKKGKKSQIKAKTILVDSKKKQLTDAHAKEFRYASSNKKVATVSKTGKITAKGKGTATIYVYSRNGYAKKVKVTVK